MKRKNYRIFLWITVLVMLLAFKAIDSQKSYALDISSENIEYTENARNGWVKSGGYWYYYKNGVKKTGWLYDDGSYYFLDSSGRMKTGWISVEGYYYFMRSNGKMAKNWLLYKNVWYYLGSNGKMRTGWQTVDGKRYYLGTNGKMVTGTQKINGNTYKFNTNGVLQASGWLKTNNKWFYFIDNKVQTGWLKDKGYYYLLASDGAMKTGWQKYNGYWYLLSSNGKMLTGWQKSNGNWYLLGSGGKMKTGWQKSGGYWYLLNSSGRMLTGWQKSGGYWYLLGSGGKMKTGWQKSGGYWYLLNSNGKMLTGWQKSGGYWYLLGSGGKMKTGWQKSGGYWYLLASNGKMLTGWQKSGSYWYFLGSGGKMKIGWQKVSDRWYYLDSNGHMVTGWYNVDGTQNYFNKSGVWIGTSITQNGVVYSYLTDTTLQVTGYTGSASSVTILSSYDGMKVTQIASGAFSNASTVKTVSLPSSLTYISPSAFTGANNLETVTAASGTYAYTWGRNNGYIHKAFALVIGEKTFLTYNSSTKTYGIDTTLRNVGDADNMETMLKSVKSRYGNNFEVTKLINASYTNIRNAIQTTFSDTKDGDVSLFFIATHGASSHDGELSMPFLGSASSESDRDAFYNGYTYLGIDTLAQWLSAYVKGEVIVILESCGAGSGIYSAAEQNSVAASSEYDPEKFVQYAITAFEEEEQRLQDEEEDLAQKSTGDLRKSKYYVLAAARHQELSWGTESGPYNYFTKWLLDGIGSKGNSPADTNGNSKLDLTELFNYIKQVGDPVNFRYKHDDGSIELVHQHVQRYPVNSTQVLFWHK